MKHAPLIILIILLLCCGANAQSEVDLGVARDGVYSNPTFGFTFKYPKDWVVHGEATNERIRELGKEKITESGTPKASIDVAVKHTYQLLTVFQHAVGTPGVTFNPGILVIAENIAHAPGITNGKDYLLNVRTILTRAGYQFLVKEPVEYHFGGLQFFRDDSAVEINGVHLVQAHFVMLKNRYAIVFAFLGGDEKSVDEMAKAMETVDFKPVRRGVTIEAGAPPPHKPN
jgi:hypothetical protein